MANPSTVLSDARFLTSRPGFSAVDLLRERGSPRLADLPELGQWIDAAADAAGVSRELMCAVPQKEQSALTKSTLSEWALTAFCGYGVYGPGVMPKKEWRGPKNQLYAAARGLRSLFDRAHEVRTEWHATVGRLFERGQVTPANRATAALCSYTPTVDDKTNLLSIWNLFGFGDPTGGEEPKPMKLIAPIEGFETAKINNTLHGRSVYRSSDVPGHNVFKGYSTWAANGHKGVGAGLDIAGTGWQTPVVAVCDGTITRWRNDVSKLEVIYLEAPDVVGVYAHINYELEEIGAKVRQGQRLGVVRGDLNWPHLHFELWLNGRALAAPTPGQLRGVMMSKFGSDDATAPSVWAQAAWDWALENGLATNGPTEPVTKQQVMTYLYRYHQMFGGE